MALLGQLAVSIIGDTSGYSDGLNKAQRETIKFTKGIESMGRDIAKVGYGFQDLGQSLTNKITKPALVATTAAVGLVSALGFKRLVGMDNAQAKLKGLGVEGKQLDVVMTNVKTAVQGTTHTMADGADVAAGALAAGVKEGAELERYIKLVGDAATGSNRPMGEMAMIFNRVQGSGKLMTQELNMIEIGMPGFAQAMANNLADGSLEAFRDMVTNGEVGTEEFLNVMEGFAGGMSEAYAETWSGLKDNILSNIGIIGEALLEGLFEDGKKGMANFLDFLRNSESLKQWATDTGESIRSTIQSVVEKISELKSKWDDLSAPMQDIIKKIALFSGIGAVAIGPILLTLGKLIVFVGNAVTKFGAITAAVTRLGGVFGILTGPIGITIGIITALIGVGVLLYKNWDTIKDKAQTVFTSFSPLLDVVKGAFQSLLDSVGPITESLKGLWESLLPILEKLGLIIAAIVVPAFGILVSVFSAVIAAIGPFVTAIINVIDVILNVFNALIALLMGDFTGALEFWKQASESTVEFVKNLWETVINFFSTLVESIIEFFHNLYMTLVGNSIIPDMVEAIVEWFKNLFDWLIDIVANIVEGVIEFFTNLSDKSTEIFEAFSTFIVAIWSYIEKTFENALSFIVALVTGDFEGMKNAMQNQMENARNLLSNIWDLIKVLIGKKASEILSNVTSKFIEIKNNIQNKITEAKDQVVSKFTDMVSNVKSKSSEIVSTAKSKFDEAKQKIIKPIEEAKTKISNIVDDIKGFFTNMKLKLPKIEVPKLPKFSLKGSFSLKPPSVPKIGVNWNAMGGIFKRPTIFNTANAGLQGVGEAGAEAIIPLNTKTLSSIGEAIAKTMKDNTQSVRNENNITIHATIREEQDIDRLVRILDEKLSELGNRRNHAFGRR